MKEFNIMFSDSPLLVRIERKHPKEKALPRYIERTFEYLINNHLEELKEVGETYYCDNEAFDRLINYILKNNTPHYILNYTKSNKFYCKNNKEYIPLRKIINDFHKGKTFFLENIENYPMEKMINKLKLNSMEDSFVSLINVYKIGSEKERDEINNIYSKDEIFYDKKTHFKIKNIENNIYELEKKESILKNELIENIEILRKEELLNKKREIKELELEISDYYLEKSIEEDNFLESKI